MSHPADRYAHSLEMGASPADIHDLRGDERRRFTIGHELTHFLCPWHEPSSANGFFCSSADMTRTQETMSDRGLNIEVQANRFSALLLMPAASITKDLKNKAGVDIDHILNLAARYVTSKEAMARRYVELRGERCAAIVSRNDQIKRIYKHADFPVLEVWPDQPVPKASLTARKSLTIGKCTDAEEVDGNVWLKESMGRTLPALIEQVYTQQGGYRLTLLSLDEEEIEDAQEEEELRESWSIRFKR